MAYFYGLAKNATHGLDNGSAPNRRRQITWMFQIWRLLNCVLQLGVIACRMDDFSNQLAYIGGYAQYTVHAMFTVSIVWLLTYE